MAEILAILALAALFVAFGLLRPADRPSGCRSCSHATSSECDAECPLLRDVFETQPETKAVR